MKKTYETDLLVIGGGAAGLCAAAEAAGVKHPQQGVYYQVTPTATINLVVDGQVLASAVVRASALAMS